MHAQKHDYLTFSGISLKAVSGPLHVLIMLPGTLFFQLFTWLSSRYSMTSI